MLSGNVSLGEFLAEAEGLRSLLVLRLAGDCPRASSRLVVAMFCSRELDASSGEPAMISATTWRGGVEELLGCMSLVGVLGRIVSLEVPGFAGTGWKESFVCVSFRLFGALCFDGVSELSSSRERLFLRLGVLETVEYSSRVSFWRRVVLFNKVEVKICEL